MLNRCFVGHQLSNPKLPQEYLPFILTDCAHVMCNQCYLKSRDHVQTNTTNAEAAKAIQANQNVLKCPICQSDSLQVPLIDDRLPDSVKPFFISTNSQFETLSIANKFQLENSFRLIKHLRAKVEKYQAIVVDSKSTALQLRDLKTELKTLQQENARLRKILGSSCGESSQADRPKLINFTSSATQSTSNATMLFTPDLAVKDKAFSIKSPLFEEQQNATTTPSARRIGTGGPPVGSINFFTNKRPSPAPLKSLNDSTKGLSRSQSPLLGRRGGSTNSYVFSTPQRPAAAYSCPNTQPVGGKERKSAWMQSAITSTPLSARQAHTFHNRQRKAEHAPNEPKQGVEKVSVQRPNSASSTVHYIPVRKN